MTWTILLNIILTLALLFVAIWSYRVGRKTVDNIIPWVVLCTTAYYVLASILGYLWDRLFLKLLINFNLDIAVLLLVTIIIYVVTIFLVLWWQKKYLEAKSNPSITAMHVLFHFNGRISRSDFWLKGMLPVTALNVLAIILYEDGFSEITTFLFAAMLFIPAVAMYSKRLHDRDRSAWHILIALLPVLGPIWLIVEAGFLKGTVGGNRYGADPLTTI